MSQRSWTIYLPVAVAGVLLGSLGAVWMNGALPGPAQGGTETAALPAPKPPAADAIKTPPRPAADAVESQPLRMDGARGLVDLSPPATPGESGDEGKRAAVARAPAQGKRRGPAAGHAPDDNAKPGQTLNLDVPEGGDRGVAPDPAVTRRARPEADSGQEARTGTAVPFDFGNRQARATPKVKSYNLFNPDYGLHGFMKQSWINNRIGLQGGLGINDGDRIKSKGDGLGDDLAVGMGVIMAF